MKFSLSLFVFFSASVLVMALPPTAIQSLMDEQVAATRRNFLAASMKSRHEIIRRRHLQDASTDCQAAYETLYEDPTLLAAAETWLAALEERVAEPDMSLCDLTESSANCDFSEELSGTQELRDACTGAGGTPQSMEMDVSCSLNMDGETLNLIMDFPTIWECLPPNCEEELAAIVTSEFDSLEVDLEAAFSLLGISGNCDVVSGGSEDTVTPGGSDTSPPPATAPTTTSTGGGGGSDTSPPPAPAPTTTTGGSGSMMTRDTMLSTLLVLVCGALVAM
ncbi:hypothetical protein IV203_030621 [Nitzschia inconspicua]|uniref:Uncharacterized protein n=1 Tax=Nitzschia inconspicua TaxID=303405 RepID=A0A9K3KP57_9STRA|nr:hypothetical protein IV203_015959 [Nitzschia inconspicua]KAG7367878.1 hypothetical protein IV203_030621 [Nitzschia inconspicua]